MTDRTWPNTTGRIENRQRIAARSAVSALLSAFVVVVFRDSLIAVWPLLWPPMAPYGQWSTLVLVHLLGLVALPVAFGSRIGDRLYDRFVGPS